LELSSGKRGRKRGWESGRKGYSRSSYSEKVGGGVGGGGKNNRMMKKERRNRFEKTSASQTRGKKIEKPST